MQIQDVLDEEGRGFFSLDSSKSVEDAIRLMTEKSVRALIVKENNRPVGIFTGSDVLRCYVRCEKRPYNQILLKECMTNKLIVGRQEDDIENAISLMVQADIRHLPIMGGRDIVGMVYICDLLHHQLGTLNTELRYLEEYLKDLQNAVTD